MSRGNKSNDDQTNECQSYSGRSNWINSNWIEDNLSPGLLFIKGAVFLGLNLVAAHTPEKLIILGCLVVLNLLRKRQIKPFTQLLFILFMVLLNIYPPYGKLLFHIFTFPVTEGALFNGLDKGITLVSIILTAKYSISSSLKLPGTFGRLVSRTLYYLDLMQQEQKNLKKTVFKKMNIKINIIEKIDQLILNLWETGNNSKTENNSINDKKRKSSVAGMLFAIISVLFVIFLLYLV